VTRTALWCLLAGTLLSAAPTLAAWQDEGQFASPSPPATITADDPPLASSSQDEDQDLVRIPGAAQIGNSAPAPRFTEANQRVYLENAVNVAAARGGLVVPLPSTAGSTRQELLFIDVRKTWPLAAGVNAMLSDRFTLRDESDLEFPNHENLINDFREGYLSWEPVERTYLDVGRINLKSGVALGFNPTDIFKARAVAQPLSGDPTVLREDRLGTAMVRAQQVWAAGGWMVAIAPALRAPTPLYHSTTLKSFDPSFDRTNERSRALLKGNVELVDHWAPEVLIFRDGNRTEFGINMTQSIGQRVIAYLEWAGGKRGNLINEALNYGRETGTLSSGAAPIADDAASRIRSDLSLGASYTTDFKVTLNLEYHFSQASFSRRDWSRWFDIGSAYAAQSTVPAELWYIRGYALEQQQPISRHYAFLRADWTDAFVPNLEITGFINMNLYDGSCLSQIAADYYLSNEWTLGGLVSLSTGGRRSDFGSGSQVGSVLLKVARYF
jgi:hypothetical protein